MKLDDLVQKYVELRDKKADLKKELERKTTKIDSALGMIGMHIKEFLNKTGQESAKTQFGTAYKKMSVSVKMVDADVCFKFIRENDMFDLLTKRISTDAFKQYEADGVKIPGVEKEQRVVVQVRRG